MERNRLLAMTAVVVGATLFGFLGVFTRYFNSEFGMTSIDSVVVRLSFSLSSSSSYWASWPAVS